MPYLVRLRCRFTNTSYYIVLAAHAFDEDQQTELEESSSTKILLLGPPDSDIRNQLVDQLAPLSSTPNWNFAFKATTAPWLSVQEIQMRDVTALNSLVVGNNA